jgi:hypothetical protein
MVALKTLDRFMSKGMLERISITFVAGGLKRFVAVEAFPLPD